MPSEFLSPFLDLDQDFHQDPDSESSPRVRPFQRLRSLSPLTLPTDVPDFSWGRNVLIPEQWSGRGQLPRSSLSHIPFRMDRSVSMIESGSYALGGEANQVTSPSPSLLLPPPLGACLSTTSLLSSSGPPAPFPHISNRYKTELCRTYEEHGNCAYGANCQFAHGSDDQRRLRRHHKYKTVACHTFHTLGFCPYGARCHFIHNVDEPLLPGANELLTPGTTSPVPEKHRLHPPLLRHSISFAGFSTPVQTFQPVQAVQPSSLLLTRASSVSPCTSSSSPALPSPLLPEPGPLKHCPYLFSAVADLLGHAPDSALGNTPDSTLGNTPDSTLGHTPDSVPNFYAASDCKATGSPASAFHPKIQLSHMTQQLPAPLSAPPGLHRCSSADSLSEEGYTSSCSLSSASSGMNSPSLDAQRLPVFNHLLITDE